MRAYLIFFGLFGLFVLAPVVNAEPARWRMPVSYIDAIAHKLASNETGCKPENLLAWHNGEGFASVGIGHFSWYPAGTSHNRQGFDQLLDYMRRQQVQIPSWIVQGNPWRDRDHYLAELAQGSLRISRLRHWLYATGEVQTRYIIERAIDNLHDITQRRPDLIPALQRLTQSADGWFAIIDYLNFKGAGLGSQPWGLLHVLEGVVPLQQGYSPLQAFALSARTVLENRVRIRPHESRWLPGWVARTTRYWEGQPECSPATIMTINTRGNYG